MRTLTVLAAMTLLALAGCATTGTNGDATAKNGASSGGVQNVSVGGETRIRGNYYSN